MPEETNYFKKLNAISVNDHVEQKGGLTYLSWPYAWAEIKKEDPTANYVIYENPEGLNYFHDGKTAWVKVGVTCHGIEHVEMLPVMDYKNNSIRKDNITSFDVNKTIQRCLTKAVARHGLGLYIYAGEDLPEDGTPKADPKADGGKSTTKAKGAKAPAAEDLTLTDYVKRIALMLKDMEVKEGSKETYKKIVVDVTGSADFKVKTATQEQLPTVVNIYSALVAKGYKY